MLKNLTTQFVYNLLRRTQRSLIALTTGFAIVGLWSSLFNSPQDYQQFETVRIMYVHVPAAWLAMGCYFLIGLLSAITIVSGNRLFSLTAQALAPIGLIYTLICLATGMIWGYPIWGTYWVWDARLTSMAVLGFLYIGYIIVNFQTQHQPTSDRVPAMIALIGCINLPIIKWSVDWWSTLHQPATILRLSGPKLDPSMLMPLSIMMGFFVCLTALLWLIQCETILLTQKLNRAIILRRHHD